jgi:hypothetical protein
MIDWVWLLGIFREWRSRDRGRSIKLILRDWRHLLGYQRQRTQVLLRDVASDVEEQFVRQRLHGCGCGVRSSSELGTRTC